MANKEHQSLKERLQKAIIQESFFRWESAVVISLTLILATLAAILGVGTDPALPGWLWAVIIAAGAAAEGGLVYSSMTDPVFGEKVASKLLHHEFKPERLGSDDLQRKIQQALEYRSRIEAGIRDQDSSMLKDELSQTASQIDDWLENMYDLARRIDRYRMDQKIVERDRVRTEKRVSELEKDLRREDDAIVKNQIEVTLEGMRRQLDTIGRLDNTIQRAELQLENSLAHLGTVYSQTMLVDVKDIDSGRARRLRQEISEEVGELNDVLLAMDEVYSAENAA